MAQNKKNNKKKEPKWKDAKKNQQPEAKKNDMFLMLSQKVEAKDIIAVLKEKGMAGLDLWEAMGVFSVETGIDDAIDFEPIDIAETFVDPSDLAFIKNRKINTIFSFIATDVQIEALKPYLKEMKDCFGGFACGDSDDFHPIIELN